MADSVPRGCLYMILGVIIALFFGAMAVIQVNPASGGDSSGIPTAVILAFACVVGAGVAILGGLILKPKQRDWNASVTLPVVPSDELTARLSDAFQGIQEELQRRYPTTDGYSVDVKELPGSWFSKEIRLRRRANWGLQVTVDVAERNAGMVTLSVRRESVLTTFWKETSGCQAIAIAVTFVLILAAGGAAGFSGGVGVALIVMLPFGMINDLSPATLRPNSGETSELAQTLRELTSRIIGGQE